MGGRFAFAETFIRHMPQQNLELPNATKIRKTYSLSHIFFIGAFCFFKGEEAWTGSI
jgi:hypothetical protein